jgi:DNA-binding NarL/FixJ family response regulator
VLVVADTTIRAAALSAALTDVRRGVVCSFRCGVPGDTDHVQDADGNDVAIVDADKDDRASLVAALRETAPNLPIAVTSADDDPSVLVACVRAGAAGFIGRSADLAVLADSLCRLSHEEKPICPPEITAALLRGLAVPDDHLAALTPREYQVVVLLGRGLFAKEVARKLCLRHQTVKNYSSRAFHKLGIHSRRELVSLLR